MLSASLLLLLLLLLVLLLSSKGHCHHCRMAQLFSLHTEYKIADMCLQDENTRYVCIGPVNKAINMLCCWFEDPDSEAFKRCAQSNRALCIHSVACKSVFHSIANHKCCGVL